MTAYGVVVPDLPGYFSAGDAAEETFDNAREVTEAYCKLRSEQGLSIPYRNQWRNGKKIQSAKAGGGKLLMCFCDNRS